ncbi:hypothetical protein TanjilG_06339 [Lupinus angustifolius]|uniref:BHLH domain-containing protein n=1 Tax=Lupinus angustifolius TaxID=3871 RepID=A0A1J7H3M9_LUPAN|nr:hypothetical protein TanjilG_06339 [Lupinus angustifolius]
MEKDKVEEVVDMKSCGLWRCSEKVTTWRGDLITPVVEESEEDDVGRRRLRSCFVKYIDITISPSMEMRKVEILTLRNKLKALCTYGDDGEDGSSYAIFWSFHPQNPLIIGKAAFTGKQWVHSDDQNQRWNLSGQNIFETTVAIPIKACGVVQFGSRKKILENVEFLEQTQRLLMEMDNVGMVDMSGNAVSPLDCEDYDLNSLLASFSSENLYDSTHKYAHSENSEDIMRKVYSSEKTLSGEASCNPLNSSNFEHEFSPNKRQAVEFAPTNIYPIQFGHRARPTEATSDLMGSISYLEKTNNLARKKDTFPELQVPRWIDDGHSINIGKVVPAHHQTHKPEEGTTKRTKKRARPKESTRPQPKDRQQIQDCIKELREIIPNGEKYSIDLLLEETHKYMGYLQSLTKYADKLQEPIEQKANEVALEDRNVEHPIIVEDMNTPGLMRIEFLCKDKGHFLEIAETIRDIRLNILIATMEPRKNKLWGYFIVAEKQILECNNIVQQAKRHLTSKDVFYFLFDLLQQTYTSRMDSANNIANDIVLEKQ